MLGNNMFAYCNNNPVISSDYYGCWGSNKGIGNPNNYVDDGIDRLSYRVSFPARNLDEEIKYAKEIIVEAINQGIVNLNL